jgi:hypothetical protein
LHEKVIVILKSHFLFIFFFVDCIFNFICKTGKRLPDRAPDGRRASSLSAVPALTAHVSAIR